MWGWPSTGLDVARSFIFIFVLIFFRVHTGLGDIKVINGLGDAE